MEIVEYSLYSEEVVSLLARWGKQWVIITDHTVRALFGEKLQAFLKAHQFVVHLISFPPGEASKTREVKAWLEDEMFGYGCNKDWSVVALGGGVVTDIAGYVASTFCRGIPLVNIPTTLLGMVDASLGGKNGINLPWGKNLIGTIYPPKVIVIDHACLYALPNLHGGLEETVKHALIADPLLFTFLETQREAILAREETTLELLIDQSCHVKMQILYEDLDESQGKRLLLNFGHTVGHAIESRSGYTITHGDAVAIGMRLEGRLALEMGYLCLPDYERIVRLFDQYELASQAFQEEEVEALWLYMCRDKKAVRGQVRMIVLEGIGKAACRYIDQEVWKRACHEQAVCQS